MHALVTALTITSGVTVALVVIVGVGAWFASGLKPGDVP